MKGEYILENQPCEAPLFNPIKDVSSICHHSWSLLAVIDAHKDFSRDRSLDNQAQRPSTEQMKGSSSESVYLDEGSANASLSVTARKVRRLQKPPRFQSQEIITNAPYNDGYQWRKYGEKMINGFAFPRFYYKCSYNKDNGCQAKKRVQQEINDGQPIFHVTYEKKHTCETRSTSSCPGGHHLLQYYDQMPTSSMVLQFDSNSPETCEGREKPSLSVQSTNSTVNSSTSSHHVDQLILGDPTTASHSLLPFKSKSYEVLKQEELLKPNLSNSILASEEKIAHSQQIILHSASSVSFPESSYLEFTTMEHLPDRSMNTDLATTISESINSIFLDEYLLPFLFE